MDKNHKCKCRSGCRTKRCVCLKHNECCNGNCGCTDCQNPLNPAVPLPNTQPPSTENSNESLPDLLEELRRLRLVSYEEITNPVATKKSRFKNIAVITLVVGIIAAVVAICQLGQSSQASMSQDAAQATVIAIMHAQLDVQKQIATAQAQMVNSGPTATAIAKIIAELSATQESLEAERRELEPPSTELESVDNLIRQNKFDAAAGKLEHLQKDYPASSEVYYRGIKVLVLESKWAMTLPAGEQRTQVMTNAMYWQDYLGLICETSDSYIAIYGSLDKHFNTVKKLHDISTKALNEQPCKQRTMDGFNAEEFVLRLEPFSNFMEEMSSFTFE